MAEKKLSIHLEYIIYSTPDKVFEALTKPSIISKWSGSKGKVSEKIGGEFELFDDWVKGEVLIYEPGKKLSYTWKPAEWDKKTLPSTVSYTFKDHAAGTEILLEHADLPSEEETVKHKNGWIDYVFEPLNDYFTT